METFRVTRILAPTDLSAASLPALRYARLFATCFSAKLTVMFSDPPIYAGDFPGPVAGLGPEHVENLRTELEKHAGDALAGCPFDVDVTVGDPIPSILAAAKETKADLIIVGTHLRQGWRRALIGSVSDGVLYGSECPVLTVAGQDHLLRAAGFKNVLCPVNFTEVAAESMHVAAGVAAAFGAHLTAVQVVNAEDPIAFARDEERVRRWIAPELQDNCSYRELVVRGSAAERVLDYADDFRADLLVIGAQHERFRNATVLGATTERLIRFASSPVLVVPRHAARRQSALFNDAELLVAAGR